MYFAIPVSARFVLKVLELHGKMSRSELSVQTGMSERTIRHALKILREQGLIFWHIDLRDTRKRFYTIATKI
jgi:DNA-binding transcriptional ArsR family regulator